MTRTLEATLNADGTLDPERPLPRGRTRRVLITILDEAPSKRSTPSGTAGESAEASSPAAAAEQAEQRVIGSAGVSLAGRVLEPEDFTDWSSYPGKRSDKE